MALRPLLGLKQRPGSSSTPSPSACSSHPLTCLLGTSASSHVVVMGGPHLTTCMALRLRGQVELQEFQWLSNAIVLYCALRMHCLATEIPVPTAIVTQGLPIQLWNGLFYWRRVLPLSPAPPHLLAFRKLLKTELFQGSIFIRHADLFCCAIFIITFSWTYCHLY